MYFNERLIMPRKKYTGILLVVLLASLAGAEETAAVDASAIHDGVFAVDIPVTGAYRVEVFAAGDGLIHLEDYIHNTDDRTYNITAAIPIRSLRQPVVAVKDGSPLAAGRHDMRVVTTDGTVIVQSIRFTLIQKRDRTPYTLKQNLEGDHWVLVWSDEFEKDGLPDPAIWTYDVGNWGWGNNEPEYYTTNRLENAHCENGRLIVEARKDLPDGGWSSARLTTAGRVSFLYGRIEFRARTTAGDGNWAAVWMLGDSFRDEKSWPDCGEVDILELVGRDIDDVTGDGMTHFACHTRAYYFKQNNQIDAWGKVKNMTGMFHTYALEWTPEAMKIFYDGELAYTYDKTGDELSYPFNQPQNLIVNMAMGGAMGGVIDPHLTSERLELEYIRVYGRQ